MLVFAVEVGVALFAAVEVGCCGESQAPDVGRHDLPAVIQLDPLWELHAVDIDEACLRVPSAAPAGCILVGDDLEAAHCPPLRQWERGHKRHYVGLLWLRMNNKWYES